MTVKTIPLTAVSVQSAKPSTRFGLLSILPLGAAPGAGVILARGALTSIPTGATVTSALLVLRSRNTPTWSGAKTVKARALLAAFSTSTVWNNSPATTATNEATTTLTSAAFGQVWNLDVTAIVQAWVSGTLVNNGFNIFAPAGTTGGLFQGTTAAWGTPALVVDYATSAQAPTALHPSSGATSRTKPTLQFQTPSDTVSIQVQIDPAANAVSPGFDSGEVASTAGLLDLSTTAYADLADGASTQWRARIKNPLGWSAWSSWVTFTRTAWKTLAVTSPGATSEDPSPTVQATYTSGTITSWRVLTKGPTGLVVQDSGWTPGGTVSFGTTKSVGASGTAVVQIHDNVTRDATPGDPDYLEATQAFTVTPSGSPSVIASFTATSNGVSPLVTLTGTRATIPDEVAIYRNDVLIDRQPGSSVFVSTAFTYLDRSAPMNAPAAYKVYAVAAGAWSNASSTVTLTPTCTGIWLLDTLSTDAVLILGDDDLDQTQPETAIVHRPVAGPDGDPQVVRRRLSRYPREGVVSGVLVDALSVAAATSEAVLRTWADNDAGHIYRLVLGNQNDPVILGDITFGEVAINNKNQRVLDVSANWWTQK